jgi:molybdopterin-dependent oxidoreductase alpha subunit
MQNELTPEKHTGLTIKKPKRKAVGLPAIASSVVQIGRFMNFREGVKTMFRINQKGGFDCPGCAWPDPDDERSALGEYCENGIKAIAEEASAKRLTADFFKTHSITDLAKWSDYDLGKSGRLTEPLILRGYHYEPIAWQEVFDLIANQLLRLDSPNQAVFYTSGRTSNESAFLYQLFARQYGTNNLPDCSNMCHESSGKALSSTIGIGKGTVTLDDFEHADLVIVMGQNPGTNHPRMLSALEKTKQNGGRIIAINPLPEAGLLHFINPQSIGSILRGGTPLADLFLQVRINQDLALLKAILKILTSQSSEDRDFIREKTIGYDAFVADLERYDLDKCIEQTGIPENLIREAAQWIASSERMIVCWAMGLTQHKNAVATIRELVNLILLRGSIGKKGAGLCPVRGHSNVQGDRTMGIWEAPPSTFLDKLDRVFDMVSPRQHGFNTVEAIQAMHDGRAKCFFALGGNFLSASPDTVLTAEALRRCDLTVHVSTKLNRSHLVTGKTALILPCLGRTDKDIQPSGEQFVTCENSMGIVHRSQGVLTPPSEHLRSEVWIVCQLAHAVFQKQLSLNPELSTPKNVKPNWLALSEDYDRIRDLIAETIVGFEDFNKKVRQDAGFYLPNRPRDEQAFNTKEEKAHFTINLLQDWELKKGTYLMMTIRSHDQFNTTVYGLNDRYRGIQNERRVILMNEKDIHTEGYRAGDVVDIFSHFKNIERTARRFIIVPYDIPQGNVASYFPEANTLIPIDSFADESMTPTSKSVVVTIKRSCDSFTSFGT